MKKKLRVIIDTNIFISALLGSKSCQFICRYFEERRFVLILSESIIREIKEVLTDKELGNISTEDTERLFRAIDINAELVKPSIKINVCRDSEDDKILEAAFAGHADLIVSGDKDLLTLKTFRGIPIITSKEFLRSLEK